MQNTVRRAKITVSADGEGLVSQAGVLLLAEAIRVSGLRRGLSGGLARWRAPGGRCMTLAGRLAAAITRLQALAPG